MESRANVTNINYYNEPATIRYENNQIVVLTKNRWAWRLFGLVGQALATEKERFRIKISEISCVELRESRKGKPIYEFTLINGEKHEFKFWNIDELTDFLKQF